MSKEIKYTDTQLEVIARYLKATEDCPETRMPLEKLIGMKNKIPKMRPDKAILKQLEENYLLEDHVEVGRPKRQIDNTKVNSVFGNYVDYYDARRNFYWLDDILVGVSRLDLGGNTRPLSIGVLYNFVSTSTVINTDIIKQFCDVKDRQAQKIMLSMVVVHRMIEKELLRMGLIV